MKTCTKCTENKGIELFSKKSASVDGLRPQCKECDKVARAIYNSSHKEERKIYRDKWRIENKDHERSYAKEYRKGKEEQKRHYNREYSRNRKASDPLFKLRCGLRTLLWQCFKTKGYKKGSKTSDILGTDYETVQQHLKDSFSRNYDVSWEMKELLAPDLALHIDHIIPISSAKTESEVYELNHYTNLQYLTAFDNISKGARYDIIEISKDSP